jgi:uncharacterized repeat protein (TIGR03803 family)
LQSLRRHAVATCELHSLERTSSDGNGCIDGGCGTVFKFSAGGKESVLYNFKGQSDGGYPDVGVVEDSNYNLYGTTPLGGDPNCTTYGQSCGVIFEITADEHRSK